MALDGRGHIGQSRACVQVLASGHGRVGSMVSGEEMSCGCDAVAILAVFHALGGRRRGLTEGKLLPIVFLHHGYNIHGRRSFPEGVVSASLSPLMFYRCKPKVLGLACGSSLTSCSS
jgi:hypothetical protein